MGRTARPWASCLRQTQHGGPQPGARATRITAGCGVSLHGPPLPFGRLMISVMPVRVLEVRAAPAVVDPAGLTVPGMGAMGHPGLRRPMGGGKKKGAVAALTASAPLCVDNHTRRRTTASRPAYGWRGPAGSGGGVTASSAGTAVRPATAATATTIAALRHRAEQRLGEQRQTPPSRPPPRCRRSARYGRRWRRLQLGDDVVADLGALHLNRSCERPGSPCMTNPVTPPHPGPGPLPWSRRSPPHLATTTSNGWPRSHEPFASYATATQGGGSPKCAPHVNQLRGVLHRSPPHPRKLVLARCAVPQYLQGSPCFPWPPNEALGATAIPG
jgi:hypothetical protein